MPGRDEQFKGDLGKLLREAQVVQPARPVTSRQTFVTLIADLQLLTIRDDASSKCVAYMLRFHDQAEGIVYSFQFETNLMSELKTWVENVPEIGEVIPE